MIKNDYLRVLVNDLNQNQLRLLCKYMEQVVKDIKEDNYSKPKNKLVVEYRKSVM